MSEIGHNSADKQLQSYVSRIERLEEEKAGIAGDIKDIYVEVKSAGFDPKIVRQLIRERKMEAADREERDALLDTYRRALGMLDGTPLGEAALKAAQ